MSTIKKYKIALAEFSPEIASQWHPTKNGSLTPNQVAPGSHKKVWWKCHKGTWPDGSYADDHEWESKIDNRTYGTQGCPCCSKQKVVSSNCLATTHPKLTKEWHPTKNGDLTPNDVVSGTHRKVWWKCKFDHEWESVLNSRSSRISQCPLCSNKSVCLSNCLATTRPELAKEWHATKNGKLTPYDITAGSSKKVWWKCHKGTWPDGSYADDHEWKATVADRKTKGCPCCSKQKIVFSNCLATTHPEIASQWHSTKNGNLTPNDVVAGSSKKVWWKCHKGTWPDGSYAEDHEWETRISHRHGLGCTCCSKRKIVPSNCLATTHPELAKEWHLTKNGNLTPYDVVAGSHVQIWWKCHKGTWPDGTYADDHEWEAPLYHRVEGTNCPCCSNSILKVVPSNCLATTHPELAKEWHSTKNGILTPYEVVAGSNKSYWWTCDKGKKFAHEYKANLNDRVYGGNGCPICKESKGEKSIRSYFEQKHIKYKSQFKFSKKSSISTSRFDFRVNGNKSFVLEYHGQQHYYPIPFTTKSKDEQSKIFISAIKRDTKKKAWCKKYNIPLLTIPYWENNNIPTILNEYFAGKEPKISEPPEIVKKYSEIREKIAKAALDNLDLQKL